MVAVWQLLIISLIYRLQWGLTNLSSDMLFGGANNAQENQSSYTLQINQQSLMLPTRDGGKNNKMVY